MHSNQMINPPNQIIEYLILAGFYGAARVGQFDYDRGLVSALVERWRPETHTFHTTRGECTITLEDVAKQLGLPCEGMAVIGRTDFNWQDICECFLGIRPSADRLSGQRLLISWLEENFNHLPDNADDVQVQQFTRAYILRLIGGYLMPDRSGSRVYLMYLPLLYDLQEAGKYSWGSAVLAHLYRELCNATNPTEDGIGGCLSLLHLWAWDRFPMLAPQQPRYPDPQSDIYPLLPPLGFRWKNVRQNPRPLAASLIRYRSFLDKMTDDEIIWQPYESPYVRQLIPEYCLTIPEIWRASVPLICFNIIEWHHPDRVLQQFGRQQPIPSMPVHLRNYHTIQLRGKTTTNWIDKYADFIQAWDRWPHVIVNAPIAFDELDRISQYMQWYWRHTRRWIQRISSDTGRASDIAEELYRLSINSRSTCPSCVDYRDRVAHDQRNILLALREQCFNVNPQPAPPTIELPRPQIPRDRPSKRRGGYLSTQPIIENENAREQEPPIFTQASDISLSPSSPFISIDPTQLESRYMAPSSSSPSNSANPSQFQPFMTLLDNPALFSAEYNASTFEHGGPSNEAFVTPRQSIHLNESPWFDLNTPTIQTNETFEAQEIDIQQQRP
ncbi:serine/threonine-protein phosphatase 7 long form homolog [Neltuma alba]|uniref:serine/threonine-protein phosphatase 7 long form homolog n=1 Tax=Neltuma alba TaxID=207710 RepID=UPI0010A55B57|nr:serine/threonine-protein phosphatase 7 long form homolog [Prosopis alba]